jgi:predicted CXXCH cytochrome family protein
MLLPVLVLTGSPVWADNETCLECHASQDIVGAAQFIDRSGFDHTAHAELGCALCHASVSDNHPDDGLKPSRPVCRDCHEPTEQAYAASVHAQNAACADCHNPHRARGATQISGQQMNQMCASCHQLAEVAAGHAQWLPQAELHIQTLPCVTCHTGSQNYVIALYLSYRQAGSPRLLTAEELAELDPWRGGLGLLDTNGDGYIALAELQRFNRDPLYQALQLQGMMVPEEVTHSFQILDNRWDCSFCHASGAQAAQTSFLYLPQRDASFSRVAIEKGAVLDLLYGTPNFYMLGATRSATLDILGLLIVAGGLVMPLGHGTLRFLTRQRRQGKDD